MGRDTRHRDGATFVPNAFLAFILYRRTGRFLDHAGLEPATLDDKIINHSVEQGIVIETVAYILDEVLDRYGCTIRVQFEQDLAIAGIDLDLWIFVGWDHSGRGPITLLLLIVGDGLAARNFSPLGTVPGGKVLLIR